MEFCFSSERMCLLPRVVFQQRIASRWAASDPPWVPCHLPTSMNTHWNPSTTKSPHPRSTRSLQVTFLCPHPMLPRWPGPTSAVWVQSPLWSLHRTGMAQSSSLSSSGDKTVQQEMVMDYRSRTEANTDTPGRIDELTWLLVLQYLQTKINRFGLSTVVLRGEYGGNHHMNFLSNTNLKVLWSFLSGIYHWNRNINQTGQTRYYTVHRGMHFFFRYRIYLDDHGCVFNADSAPAPIGHLCACLYV